MVIGIVVAAVAAAGDAAVGDTTVTFAVTSTADAVDAKPGDGICRTAARVCTLRAALNEASALPSDGTPVTITVRAGTFVLRLARPKDASRDELGGDLDLATDGTAPPSVTITGAGAGKTVIRQTKPDRVLEIGASEPVSISNLTITGGHGVATGGGVYNGDAGGLTLRGVEIASNSADAGGGIYSARPLTIVRSRVTDNAVGTGGGGIALNGHGATLTGATVSGNTAERLGGGIWARNVDSLEIDQSLVIDNSVTTTGRAECRRTAAGSWSAPTPRPAGRLRSTSRTRRSGATRRPAAAVSRGRRRARCSSSAHSSRPTSPSSAERSRPGRSRRRTRATPRRS